MKFRYARHTSNLKAIEDFYINIVGLEKLGHFVNHNNYNGVFLGYPNHDWHLEFTASNDQPKQLFDEDDILVFYIDHRQMMEMKNKIFINNIHIKEPKNPYWKENGIMITDSDGYNIVFTVKENTI